MDIISRREFVNRGNQTIMYELDDNVLRSNIIDVLMGFQSEKNLFLNCECSTYDEDGIVLRRVFNKIDELAELKDYPSPYMSFIADYIDADTGKYIYTVSTETNNNKVECVIDKKNNR